MGENYSTNKMAGDGGNSRKHDQKLIKPREAPDEFAYEIWA